FFLFFYFFFLFFFFQAEDGIRDRTVTGVQTCALPILSFDQYLPDSDWGDIDQKIFDIHSQEAEGEGPTVELTEDFPTFRNAIDRSEERRVGKECRSRCAT